MAFNKENLQSFSDIFNDVQFEIPDYQRGYSWECEDQLEDLWEDLENMPDGSDHYTGMFTFFEKEEKIYSIVDGQQRMTTLIILINELLKLITGPIDDYHTKEDFIRQYLYIKPVHAVSTNLKYRFQYAADDPSDAYFKTQILDTPYSGQYLQPSETLYTINLRNAKDFFHKKIENYSQNQLIELFNKITKRLKFNTYIIDDVNDVYVTFETMNNRGKDLSTLELLKNRLIYLTTLFSSLSASDSTQQANVISLRKNINDTWKTIYQFLGKSTKKKLNDDSFLRDHWIMYFRYNRSSSMVFKNDLLSETFIAKRVLNNNELKINEIDDYVSSLRDSVIHWFNINCPSESSLPENEKLWLIRLNRIGLGSFRPLLMASYIKKDSHIENLLKACERFRFLTFNISGRRSNTEDSNFYRLAHDFYVNNDSQQPLTISDLVARINDSTDYWLDIDNFVNAVVDRYEKREGFYSWSGLRYFLYEYERDLQLQTTDADEKVSWDSFENNQANKISIEHIYPQTPTDEYWIDRFKTAEDEALTHSLGNLLLLSVAKNSAQQNYSFDIKKTTTLNNGKIDHHGYDMGSYSEIEVSRKEEWTPDEIIKRGKELLRFLHDHWELTRDFTDEEVAKLLNITSSPVVSVSSQVINDTPDWVETIDSDE